MMCKLVAFMAECDAVVDQQLVFLTMTNGYDVVCFQIFGAATYYTSAISVFDFFDPCGK